MVNMKASLMTAPPPVAVATNAEGRTLGACRDTHSVADVMRELEPPTGTRVAPWKRSMRSSERLETGRFGERDIVSANPVNEWENG